VKDGSLSRLAHNPLRYVTRERATVITLAAKVPGMNWNVTILEGDGGAGGEGSHIAVGAQELGEDTLDGFLGLLLAHLAFFRATRAAGVDVGPASRPGASPSRPGGPAS
jgi:hypothetical protein